MIICKQITCLLLYQATSSLVILPVLIYAIISVLGLNFCL
jgi:hypothetical protein